MKYRSGHAARVALSSIALAALWLPQATPGPSDSAASTFNRPSARLLRAEIDITSLTPEEESSLQVRIASPDAYRAAGVDYNAVLPSTQVSIARRPDGRPYLRVTSDRAVQEPFVDVILELTWSSGRLVREFTLLLDPPQSRVAPPAQAPAPVAPQVSAAPPATAGAGAFTGDDRCGTAPAAGGCAGAAAGSVIARHGATEQGAGRRAAERPRRVQGARGRHAVSHRQAEPARRACRSTRCWSRCSAATPAPSSATT